MIRSSKSKFIAVVSFLCALFLFNPAHAAPPSVPDVNAGRVLLTNGTCPDNNCFNDFDTMLSWVWTTRNPSAASPLLVEIDPGQFLIGGYVCIGTTANPRGYVTFRGAGQENTVLTGSPFGSTAVVTLNECTNLAFENLTIRSDSRRGLTPPSSTDGIYWVANDSGGTSTWTNVQVEASQYGWVDQCGTAGGGVHYWFASRIDSLARGYRSFCDENWFYGTEILSQSIVVEIVGTGKVFVFGGSLRSLVTSGSGVTGPQKGVSIANGGTFHMHGGIISVLHKAPTNDKDVIGIHVTGAGSTAHSPGTAYNLLPAGTGTASRLLVEAGGSAQSPFQWPSGGTPPVVVSDHGQDMFVETDCDATGCQTAGDEPHLLIYSGSCTSSWFDVVTKTCR